VRQSVSNDDLMRFLDGELPPGEVRRVEEALERSTELQRELRIFQALREDVAGLSYDPPAHSSVWDGVQRRLARPVGWILFVFGAILWAVYGAWVFASSAVNPVEKLAVGALTIGFFMLLGSTVSERIQEARTDPYRDIQR
jgi:anti-sigma factor RsiW